MLVVFKSGFYPVCPIAGESNRSILKKKYPKVVIRDR